MINLINWWPRFTFLSHQQALMHAHDALDPHQRPVTVEYQRIRDGRVTVATVCGSDGHPLKFTNSHTAAACMQSLLR